MLRERHVNLVFQGGGVRGIAYAGVLDEMPSHIRIHSLGGTSAGAIVAGLLAIGVRGTALKKLLMDPLLFELIQKSEDDRWKRVRAAFMALPGVVKTGKQGKKVALNRVLR